MKKLFLLCTAFLLLLTACNQENAGSETEDTSDVAIVEEQAEESTENKVIYTSNYPLYYFTSQIAGDKFEVRNIAENGGFHGWEPSAKDIANIKDANLFIYNGHGLEKWADELIENKTIDGDVLEVANGIDLLASTHDHDHDHEEAEEAHDHDHDHEEAEEAHDHDHDHGEFDPHIWLSLKNAKIIAENIKNKLSQIDQENADYYKENFDKLALELDNLDKEYSEKLQEKKRETIVVSHEAYGYLSRDYNFKQIGIEGINAEGEPSIAQIDNIINVSKENDVKVIFYENTISPKVAELIANEVGAELLLLSPLESLSKEQIDNNEDYLTIMKDNLEGINKALNE